MSQALCLFSASAALKNPSQGFKKKFAFGADEFLAILEGKIRVTPSF